MQLESTIVGRVNKSRRVRDLLEIEAVLALAERDNLIFDPFSTLISKRARIGSHNVFYPCVTVLCSEAGEVFLGDGNTFHTGSWISAETGPIVIGNRNQVGEGGGFTAKANRPGATIIIGDDGRYLGGASVYGESTLGSGTQVLGMITVENCVLAAGASFREPDPDRRGALLKGQGTARNLKLDVGQVIFGTGVFRIEDVKPQSFFHPKAAR